MDNKKLVKIFLALLIIALIALCLVYYSKSDNKTENKSQNYEDIKKQSTKINIEYSNEEFLGSWESYVAKITLNDDLTKVEGTGVIN